MDSTITEQLEEATTLLRELAEELHLSALDTSRPAESLAVDGTAAVDADASMTATPTPRFKTEALNAVDAKLRNAEATARAEVEKHVRANVVATRLGMAAKLASHVGGLIAKLSTPANVTSTADTDVEASAAS